MPIEMKTLTAAEAAREIATSLAVETLQDLAATITPLAQQLDTCAGTLLQETLVRALTIAILEGSKCCSTVQDRLKEILYALEANVALNTGQGEPDPSPTHPGSGTVN